MDSADSALLTKKRGVSNSPFFNPVNEQQTTSISKTSPNPIDPNRKELVRKTLEASSSSPSSPVPRQPLGETRKLTRITTPTNVTPSSGSSTPSPASFAFSSPPPRAVFSRLSSPSPSSPGTLTGDKQSAAADSDDWFSASTAQPLPPTNSIRSADPSATPPSSTTSSSRPAPKPLGAFLSTNPFTSSTTQPISAPFLNSHGVCYSQSLLQPSVLATLAANSAPQSTATSALQNDPSGYDNPVGVGDPSFLDTPPASPLQSSILTTSAAKPAEPAEPAEPAWFTGLMPLSASNNPLTASSAPSTTFPPILLAFNPSSSPSNPMVLATYVNAVSNNQDALFNPGNASLGALASNEPSSAADPAHSLSTAILNVCKLLADPSPSGSTTPEPSSSTRSFKRPGSVNLNTNLVSRSASPSTASTPQPSSSFANNNLSTAGSPPPSTAIHTSSFESKTNGAGLVPGFAVNAADNADLAVVLAAGEQPSVDGNLNGQKIAPPKSQCMTSKTLLIATTIGTFANLMFNRQVLEMSHKILDNPFFHSLKTTIPFDMTTIAMATPFAIAGAAIATDLCSKAACSRNKAKRDCTAMGNTISLLAPTALVAYYATDALGSLNGSKGSFQIPSHMVTTAMSAPFFAAAYQHLKSATNLPRIVNTIALGVIATNIAFLAHDSTYHHTGLEMFAGNLVGAAAAAGIYTLSSLIGRCSKFCCHKEQNQVIDGESESEADSVNEFYAIANEG